MFLCRPALDRLRETRLQTLSSMELLLALERKHRSIRADLPGLLVSVGAVSGVRRQLAEGLDIQ
jgi:hypothetical protein